MLVINSVGFGIIGDLHQIPLETEQEMIDVNVKALHYFTKAYGLEMAKRRDGGIINIASTASFISMPNFNVYAATKAFVLSFTEAVSKELQKDHVHVMALCPGPAYTEFFDIEKMNELKKKARNIPLMMQPERVVREAIYAFEKKKRICIPGVRNKLLKWIYGLIPRETILTILYRYMRVNNG
ncbi:SDR family NAD(P)-dependent oxidoreductase [Paenibacillus caui]|uniref:SDR family NAD(P)-dependent oxidoreductase n=1 Tax=Paenibacillus caui TaxID=2873927 RepID=UPI001CA95AF5|nr:SDR family NAD(P)-dependent oxidoreductase [Paenibacillus caui]